MKFNTKAVHLGQQPEPTTGAIIPPIYATSTYVQEYPNKTKGYDYTRANNPNFINFEQNIAGLEQGKYATFFASGLAGITAIATMLKAGDLVVGGNDLYGGTFRLFTQVFNAFQLKFEAIDTCNLQQVEDSFKKKPKMIFLESPSNPLLKLSDLENIAKLSKKYGVISVIDNTFATPYFQNPLTYGIDMVLHSATKYINGHSDSLGGVVVCKDENIKKKLDFLRMSLGLNASPFEAWLGSRSLKTLGLRMEKHAYNAMKLAQYFSSHPCVKKVYYPGLDSHPHHDLAKKQMKGYSGIISLELNLSVEQTKKLVGSFSLFALAESLGGVESLIDHPYSMTHASMNEIQKKNAGIQESLVRISVGIEDIEDLMQDFQDTLSTMNQ